MTTANIATTPKNNSDQVSVHQWIRSAIRDSQQPTSPIGRLCLKLPPPPCAALLVWISDKSGPGQRPWKIPLPEAAWSEQWQQWLIVVGCFVLQYISISKESVWTNKPVYQYIKGRQGFEHRSDVQNQDPSPSMANGHWIGCPTLFSDVSQPNKSWVILR